MGAGAPTAHPPDRDDPQQRGRRKETKAMNSTAIYFADQALRLANERAAAYRREAAQDRLAAAATRGRPRFRSISAALASLRATFASVDPEARPGLPSLNDYPYRG
jgi:hypothetical protein